MYGMSCIERERRPARNGLLATLAVCTSLLMPIASAPVEAGQAPDRLPRTFKLSALSLHFSRHVGNTAYVPLEVHLSGAGGGRYVHDGREASFPYSPADVVKLLDELFRFHFFELPTRYSTRDAALGRADGTVLLATQSRSHDTGTGICVTVDAFEKCVLYGVEPPLELDRLLRQVFDDAHRLSGER